MSFKRSLDTLATVETINGKASKEKQVRKPAILLLISKASGNEPNKILSYHSIHRLIFKVLQKTIY